TTLAFGLGGAGTVDQALENFVARSTGVYYIKVTTAKNLDYKLVITRDANFDLQSGASSSAPPSNSQDVTATLLNPYGSTGGGGAIGTLVAQGTTVQGTNFEGLNFSQQPCSCLPPDNGFAVGNGF